ncbi:cholesterol oxidase substrate-binding domain-containing protein [Paraburkholderia megapolitana]|uniref:FAD binding domain-containing protein n=1 Tax=Paraburkholderia megapolitana TaxID=420953 RepID=A0A1I3D378_9BURK|nr:cholesterol oxidase substrate-binding domain-containing protein [Paraburkholderia megapolitana]QDQ81659.1 FAD-binding protein [Paraburkholderia megapolitana]SFH81234.1 FAD binding domain-containing protein [Paraburkholderia megapolitana]
MSDLIQEESDPSRRAFLSNMAKLAAAGVVAGWTPIYQIAANAQSAPATPPNFPANIPLSQQAFQNWSGEIVVSNVWTAAPTSPADVVTIVNWASANGYRVRPRGHMHNWSPLTIDPTSTGAQIVLLDTTASLTAVTVDTTTTPARVTAQTGVSLESLLATLEQYNLGVTAAPAPGDITLGGALAIDAHGTAVPATGESQLPGNTYGSLSNLVQSLTAVVYDAGQKQYVLRTFQRTDPDIGAFLTHVGRAFIVEATLEVGPNQRLRCQSFTNIPSTELFATAGSTGRTVESFLNQTGRMEAIWFPFTTNPWLKVWTVAPTQPSSSRAVTGPYNYPFSDSIPQSLSDLVSKIVIGGEQYLTPLFGQTQLGITTAGLALTGSGDIWGWSRTVLEYIRPTTLRVTANGYTVLTSRSNVQRAINEFVQFYQNRISAYQALNEYPMNGPVEIRVTGLDQPADAGAGAVVPTISALKPRPDHPEWDTAVWFDILTLPGTPLADQFYREIEQWMLSNYTGSYATVRPEWSKGWAYTNSAAWQDSTMLGTTIPNLYRDGQPATSNWDTAHNTLNQYDPQRIFASPLLDQLLP